MMVVGTLLPGMETEDTPNLDCVDAPSLLVGTLEVKDLVHSLLDPVYG